jgi:wyosine [tRNA(Phe)-imidazoG37] synthetase (radical SAM superfamily)
MARRLDFRDHRRELDRNRYVYAVVSRRARGLSIGVNLNPDKACNFDCPYCQVDRTAPAGAAAVDVRLLADELAALLGLVQDGTLWQRAPFDTAARELRRVSDIAFAGDGEPTLAAEFPDAARAARECRDARAPGVPLRLLTNAALFHAPRVREALPQFDELWCKLDAGSEGYFQRVDGTRMPLARVLDNLLLVARERPIVVQSLFLALDGEGPDDAEVDAWAERLRAIVASDGRVDHVQVYTVARRPADARVTALPLARLEQIAARARATGVRAEVYGSG